MDSAAAEQVGIEEKNGRRSDTKNQNSYESIRLQASRSECWRDRRHGFANGRFAKLGPLKERLSLNGDDDYDEEGEGHALEDLPRVRIG